MEIKDLRHCLICNTTAIKHLNKIIFMSKSKGYATHINLYLIPKSIILQIDQ